MQSGTVSDVFCLHFVFNAEPLNAHAPARQLLLTMHMQSNHNVRGRRSTPEGLASCFAAVRLPVYSCLYLYSCVGPCLTAARSSAPQAPVLTGSPGSKRAMSEERRVAATTTTGRAAVPPSIATSSGPCLTLPGDYTCPRLPTGPLPSHSDLQ